MNRPIQVSLVATLLLAALDLAGGGNGTFATVAKLFTVYFALDFVMLLGLSLFSNRSWRLTPALRWAAR